MNTRLRAVFVFLFAAFVALGAFMVVLLRSGRRWGPDAVWPEHGLVACIAGVVLTAFVHGLVEEQYRLEFRRYLLRVMALTSRRGLSLGHAFLALAEDYDGVRRRTVYRILGHLDEGRTLSEALALGAPKVVPRHVVEAVRAAERSGRLAETLEAAVEESIAVRSRKGTLGRALLYPLAIFGIGLFVTTLILPQFGNIFFQVTGKDGEPVPLPLISRLALAMGEFFSDCGFPILGVLLLLLSPFALPSVRRSFRWALDPLALRIPFLGGYARLLMGERVCRSLAAYVRAGVTLEEALPYAAASSGNLSVVRSAEGAVAALQAGAPADRAIRDLRLPRFVRARAAAATGGTPERFAAALEGLARECQWRRLRLGEILAGSVYPATLAFGSVLVFLTYGGVIAAISRLQGALIP